MKGRYLCCVISTIVLVAVAVCATGQVSRTWDAGGDGFWWFDPENWKPDGDPDPNDDLTVTSGAPWAGFDEYVYVASGSIVLNGPMAEAMFEDFQFDVGVSARGEVQVLGGAMLSSEASSLGVGATGYGTATVSGEYSRWDPTTLYVGADGKGVLHVLAGGTVGSDEGVIGGTISSVGDATVQDANSTWETYGADLTVGESGTGTLDVLSAGKVASGAGYIGRYSDGNGTVTVNDALWQLDGDLTVGECGKAALNVSSGGRVALSAMGPSSAYVGRQAGASGRVVLDGDATVLDLGYANLTVGDDGNATI